MTRKDYIKAAKMLSLYKLEDKFGKGDVIHIFAKLFADDNPRFNWDKFVAACNYDPIYPEKG